MRIAFVTPEYPPGAGLGGIATNTQAVATTLAARGHEVAVVTRSHPGAGAGSSSGGDRTTTEERDGLTITRIDHRWLPHGGAAATAERLRIAQATRRHRPDVVHAAEWFGDAWGIARFTHRPVVTRLATPTHVVEELNGDRSGGNALLHRFEREQTERSALVYAPTQAIIDRVSKDWALPPGRVRRIPNPVSIAAIRHAGERPPPERIALPDRFVVFLGRLERRKGIETLGEALAEVMAADPGLHAVLIGNDAREEGGAVMGRFRASLANSWDRVLVLGELPREEALAVVARATLSVVPSRWESFGYVCVEAMALGIPVIVSDTGGLAEIVDDGTTGWLTPPGDARALAACIQHRLDDPTGTAAVAAAGRARADDFDVETVIDAVEALLEEAAADATADPAAAFSPSLYRSGYRRYFRPEERRDPFAELYAEKRRLVLSRFDDAPRLRVADIGAGFGRIAGPLADRHDVVACDLGLEMLVEARARHGAGLAVVQADARRLPFPDGAVDRVIALDLLVHLDDLDAGLRELARIARPGGEIVFDTTNASAWWVLRYPAYTRWRPRRTWRTLRGGGVLPEWRHLVRHQTVEEVRAAAGRVGLRLDGPTGIGPAWSAKWHVWVATSETAETVATTPDAAPRPPVTGESAAPGAVAGSPRPPSRP